jgi:hypothetical protein
MRRINVMGYQESYVRMKNREDFNRLIEAFKTIGEENYNLFGGGPVEIVTLKKPIEGNLAYMCEPKINYKFEPGEKFVYFTGERFLQRSVHNMFVQIVEERYLTPKPSQIVDKSVIKNVEIYATECFPSDEIFNNEDAAEHEEFEW